MHDTPASPTGRQQEVLKQDPVITLEEARQIAIARAQRIISDCVQLAVATPPVLSAELIDQAIQHSQRCNPSDIQNERASSAARELRDVRA